MWWDDDTVERTVTKQFVCSRLSPQEIDRLDRPLGFGDELTDSTYWEWIDEKAKKIFLILNDLKLAGQIFELIDDSLDDQDLPMGLDEVERLTLKPSKDEKIKKFYHRQFHYVLRRLEKGGHIDYEDDEVTPLDVAADKKLSANQSQHIDTITLANQPGRKLCRCRIPLGPGHLSWEEFILEIGGIKDLQNGHLLSYWASYTHQGYGYVLFAPAPGFSLKSLLATMPSSLKNLDKRVRRHTVLDWIYCLVKTVCFLHDRGLSHGNIRPSTVMFSNDNHIFFSGFTRFQTDILRGVTDNTSSDKEAYDYAAPEMLFKPHSTSATSVHRSGGSSSNPTTMMHASTPTSTPNLSQQAADIFSLGCVILELLCFLLKKHGKPFAAHRTAKNKSSRRGGPGPDSSFHKNLGQVESWMAQLAKDATKKDDPLFKSIAPMLYVVEQMLAYYPLERPTANEVLEKLSQVLLTEPCGFSDPHCVRVQRDSGCDVGMGSLALGSSPLMSAHSSVDMSSRKGRLPKDGEHNRDSANSSFLSVNSSIRAAQRESVSSKNKSNSFSSQRTGEHGPEGDRGKTVPRPSLDGSLINLILF
jgi:serine/threonine protein kinase